MEAVTEQETTGAAEPTPTAEAVPTIATQVSTTIADNGRGAFLSLERRASAFLLRYGFTNLTHFLDAVRSDALLAGRVVNDLLNEQFGEDVQDANAV